MSLVREHTYVEDSAHLIELSTDKEDTAVLFVEDASAHVSLELTLAEVRRVRLMLQRMERELKLKMGL